MLNNLKDDIKDIISFKYEIDKNIIEFQKTRKEFEGDLTLVVFPLIRIFKKSPEEICNEIGYLLSKHIMFISSFNVIVNDSECPIFTGTLTHVGMISISLS